MTRPRVGLQPGDEILAEIADLLIEQNRLLGELRDRLPAVKANGGGEGEPVEVTEPAPPARPDEAKPVSAPAPKRAPQRRDDDEVSLPPPPPRAGKGSGKEAWHSFASIAKVHVPDGASRDDIIAACERAKVIDAQ